MSNIELLPCPFCGGEASVMCVSVQCKECFANIGIFSTTKEAIEAWNTRYEPPKLEPIFACASAPVLKDERVEAAYRKGRFDERLQQQIFASAV